MARDRMYFGRIAKWAQNHKLFTSNKSVLLTFRNTLTYQDNNWPRNCRKRNEKLISCHILMLLFFHYHRQYVSCCRNHFPNARMKNEQNWFGANVETFETSLKVPVHWAKI